MSSRLLSGRYELLEKIGDGGMAVVYKGRDKLLNRYIAVKILRPEFTKDASFVENFKKESQAAAGLSHPNIVGVYDVGREGNINYIVMELVEGKTLSTIISEEAPLDYRRVIDISKQVASALRTAHKNKIIHRDVKPHNIMITNDGVVKLADFGIARAINDATLSTGNKIIGSVHYFSPEQARGNYVDERSDIYSLGIVMYEMLTGKVPFEGESPVAVALKHINEEIVPPSELVTGIPPALERAVMKATNKYQTNRYKSADEMLEELDNIAFVSNVVGNSIFNEDSEIVERRNLRRDNVRDDEPKKKKDRKPLDKKTKIIAICAAAFIALLGIVLVIINTGIFSSTKPAPDFSDMTLEQAQNLAAEEGFSLEQGKDIYSADIAEGRVCQQSPQAGVETPKKGTITIYLSKGSKEGVVPNVVGMNRNDVEEYLQTYGYILGSIKTETSTEKEGTIIEQDPSAGTKLDKENRINIVISDGKGKEKGTVPSLNGKSLSEAKKAIVSAGFEVGDIQYDYSDVYGNGYVMWQQYGANTQLDKGTTIDIEVSKGEEPPDAGNNDSGKKKK